MFTESTGNAQVFSLYALCATTLHLLRQTEGEIRLSITGTSGLSVKVISQCPMHTPRVRGMQMITIKGNICFSHSASYAYIFFFLRS